MRQLEAALDSFLIFVALISTLGSGVLLVQGFRTRKAITRIGLDPERDSSPVLYWITQALYGFVLLVSTGGIALVAFDPHLLWSMPGGVVSFLIALVLLTGAILLGAALANALRTGVLVYRSDKIVRAKKPVQYWLMATLFALWTVLVAGMGAVSLVEAIIR
ncbi:MAG TPA: hypothetical protein VGG48_02900 [Rhizomicrobium sp.]